jgi:hypothetical protein
MEESSVTGYIIIRVFVDNNKNLRHEDVTFLSFLTSVLNGNT